MTNLHRNEDTPKGIYSKTPNRNLFSGQFSFSRSIQLMRATVFKIDLLAKGGIYVYGWAWMISDLGPQKWHNRQLSPPSYIKAVPSTYSMVEFLRSCLPHPPFLQTFGISAFFSLLLLPTTTSIILSISFASLNFRAGSSGDRQIPHTMPPVLAPSLASKSSKPVPFTIHPRYPEF